MNSLATSFNRGRSFLPGRLKEAADSLLRPDEPVLCELVSWPGTGIVLTDRRLIVVQSGLLATLRLSGMRTGFVSLTQVSALSIESGNWDETSGCTLRITAEGLNLPPWMDKVKVRLANLPRLFLLTQQLYAMLGRLGLEGPLSQRLPRPLPQCPVCDAPLVEISRP